MMRAIACFGLGLACSSPAPQPARTEHPAPLIGAEPPPIGTRPTSPPPPPPIGAPIDRVGRPLTGNALLGLFAPAEVSDRRKEQYNRAPQAAWPTFAPDLAASLALYDGFDGACGNQWLATAGPPADRYRALAALFADDRLWVDARSAVCTQFLAVERATLGGDPTARGDCGGRTPLYDAVDTFRSLLVGGQLTGVEDGVDRDDRIHSATQFPFLAAP